MNKKELLNSVQENKATFVAEEYITKDCWQQEYEYQGVNFIVNVYGQERWLEDDHELIEILEVEDKMADNSPEQLAQEILGLDQQIKALQSLQKEKKASLAKFFDNNKHNGSISSTFGDFKVTHKRNMNAKLDKKELDKYLSQGYTVPANLIQTKESVHTPTLNKMIETEDSMLPAVASFVKVDYTESVSVTKKEV